MLLVWVTRELQNLKGSCKTAEARHHVAWSESLKRGQESIGEGAACGDPSILEMPGL